MNLGELINGFFAREAVAKRQAELISGASLETLEALWRNWDAVSLMRINGEIVNEASVVEELKRRGSTAEDLP